MAILVVGASGATGRLVIEQLILQSQAEKEIIKIIVRSKKELAKLLPIETIQNNRLEITEATLLNMTDSQLAEQVKGCRAVISCLGHNLSMKGIYGQPRRLVTNAVQRLCTAIEASAPARKETPIKFVLMSSSGNQNTLAGEKVSRSQAMVIGLIRALVPPHADNEEVSCYLQTHFSKQHKKIAWVAVRPDSLTDELSVTEYDIYDSPIRSAIFDAGKTSRINVAYFISELVNNNRLWERWNNKMPVIYNRVN